MIETSPAGERREALLKVAEMSGASRPDHNSTGINRAIWLAGTGDRVKTVAGKEPHLWTPDDLHLAQSRMGSLKPRANAAKSQ